MNRFLATGIAALAAWASVGAHAGPALLFPDYNANFAFDAQGAPVDQYGSNGGHALYFFSPNPFTGNSAARFVFTPNAGVFSYNAASGTASLTGIVAPGLVTSANPNAADPDRTVSVSAPNRQLQVDLQFALRGIGNAGVGSGGPKKELTNNAYLSGGGPVDPATWAYFDLTAGTLSGLGEYAGLMMNLTQKPANSRYPFQLGNGADNKNQFFGLSGWFDWTVSDFGSSTSLFTSNVSGHGDVNVEDPIDSLRVPEPGSVALVAIALCGLAVSRRTNARPQA